MKDLWLKNVCAKYEHEKNLLSVQYFTFFFSISLGAHVKVAVWAR